MSFARTIVAAAALFALFSPGVSGAAEKDAAPLTVVVMDPLAAPLSCPCVAGYAQRDYTKLAAHLEKALGRPVKVHFAETLTEALKKKSDGKADLIVGKDSVVRAGAKANDLTVSPIAALTGKDGKTTQTGLIVVAASDPALTVSDLKGHRIIFGTDDCDEKHDAALKLLTELKIPTEKKPETCNACSAGATAIIDLNKQGIKAATVISSYAAPLLEGCGTIKKGDLRVVGETATVPFVVAYVNDRLSAGDKETIKTSLLSVGSDAALCKVLETKLGFVEPGNGKKK